MDHQLAILHDLAELILRIVVHVDLQAVHARSQIVAAAAQHVDMHLSGLHPQTAADEALALHAVDHKAFPVEFEGAHQNSRAAVVALHGEVE